METDHGHRVMKNSEIVASPSQLFASHSSRLLRPLRLSQLLSSMAVSALLLGCARVPITDNGGSTSVSSLSTLTTGSTQGNARACVGNTRVNQLRVDRTDLFPMNHLSFTFPAVETVDSASKVQQLLAITCRLPHTPVGVQNCPADFGLTYALTFSESGIPKLQIKVHATGCKPITGISGGTRVATPPFWTALAADLGLSKPVEYCNPFRGHYPGQIRPPCNPGTPA